MLLYSMCGCQGTQNLQWGFYVILKMAMGMSTALCIDHIGLLNGPVTFTNGGRFHVCVFDGRQYNKHQSAFYICPN